MKFEEFIKEFLNWSKGEHITSTTESYALALQKLATILENDILLKDIGVSHAESFIASCRKSGNKNNFFEIKYYHNFL